VVVGGGIAGIAAAIRLAEAGVAVELLETRKKLGGRATSFTDVRTGLTIDNCQHVTLGCCTNYLDLLRRLGAEGRIRWDREQYWIERGGATSTITASALLGAPLHFTGSVLGAKFLSLADLAMLARVGPAIIRADRARHVGETFAQFLTRHGQSKRLVDRFWAPVVVSACNLTCERVSAAAALHVFQDGFFANPRAADIGVSTVPLVELYDQAERAIAAAGGSVRLGCGVDSVGVKSVALSSGERLEADAVICALPPERAATTIDPALFTGDARLPALAKITHSPILGVHCTFDRPVLDRPHAVLVEGAVQWLFRKDDAGAHLHAVISAADDWVELSETQIAQRVLDDVRAYLPLAANAQMLTCRPVKEKRATFAATPEVEPIRPRTLGPSGLILAGDYTATGWPATMEGAARSGYAAAAAVLGRPMRTMMTPDLAPGRLVRLLGYRPQPSPFRDEPLAPALNTER
jgi:zeta-carotene desaturase